MKNALVQILIATVAGVLASLIVMPLQAPGRPLEGPELLMVYVDTPRNEKTALLVSQGGFRHTETTALRQVVLVITQELPS